MNAVSAHRSSKLEPWVFGALMVLHALPVLAFPWFPTLDGPAHLYNARIICSILGGDADVARFFELNPFPEPNWLGHALMAGTMAIASAQVAEKTVMLLYVVGLPLAFRSTVRRIGDGNPWGSLLIFPFIWSFTFRIGFLNFSLGLPLLLLVMGAGVKDIRLSGLGRLAGMSMLLTLTYFAHLTCFLLATALLMGLAWRSAWAESVDEGRPFWRALGQASRAPLLALAPGLLLSAAFFLSHQDERAQLEHLPMGELLSGLFNGRPFVTLSEAEIPYAQAVTWSMAMMTVSAILIAVRRLGLRAWRLAWLTTAIAGLLVAYLVMPDQLATGGFISVRLLLFAYLLWALWLGSQALPGWLNAPMLLVIITADLLHLRVHSDHTDGLNAELEEMLSVSPFLPEHAVLVPLNYSGNWMHSNFPCYLGATRNALVLDNFGARTPHMPVRWRDKADPSDAIGSFATSDRPCVRLNLPGTDGSPFIDHVLTWKMRDDMVDSCTAYVRRRLEQDFGLVAISPLGDARLYRRK